MKTSHEQAHDVLLTLQSLVEALGRYGQRPALLALQPADVERWSYADLAGQVQRLAWGLARAGLGRGDTAAIFADNRPEWIVACLAVIKAGGLVLPVDVQLGDQSLTHVLNDSCARFIFTTRDGARRLERLQLDTRVQPILLDVAEDEARCWRRLQAEEPTDLPSVSPDEAAVLFYTSGTTGRPKGVPLSHTNLVGQLNLVPEARLASSNDHFLLPLPLHHAYPFVFGMLTPLRMGAVVVLPHALTGPQLIRALREGGVTMIIGVPRLYSALYAGIEAKLKSAGGFARRLFALLFGLSSWLRRRLAIRAGKWLLASLHQQIGPGVRVMASGGAALDPDLAWKLEALGWQVSVGYGLTETAPLLSLDPPGSAKIGSVGRAVPGVELRIDPTVGPEESRETISGSPQANKTRVVGEILARGPNVFAGYHNLPEESRRAFTDDWFRTGDLGYFDEEGYLYILGRASTMIVTAGGENVQPEDVERAYEQSPVIREIGILQKSGKLVGVVVPRLSAISAGTGDRIEAAIREAVRQQSKPLPSYQQITDYVIVRDRLPRTRLGKIRRHLLSPLYEQARTGQPTAVAAPSGPLAVEEMSIEDRMLLDNHAAKQVWDWLAQRYPDKPLSPETSPQFDLGIDSLGWLNLTLEIGQQIGIELSEEAIARIDTVHDLLQAVADAAEQGAGTQHIDPLKAPEQMLTAQQRKWLKPLGQGRAALATGLFVLNRFLMNHLFHLQVKGAENVPADGPFVLTPNHVSYLDPFAIGAAFTNRQLRETYWAGWTGVAFRNAFFRSFSRLAKVVPVDPDRAVLSSLAFGAAVLQRRMNLVWFPEGGRAATGQLQPFKPGIGLLLEHYPVPVIPVVLRGSYEAWPTGQFFPRPGQVTVVFGPPLNPTQLRERDSGKAAHNRLADNLFSAVAELAARQ